MTKFRPCIDLHSGQVKQIVGGTLSKVDSDLKTNYVSKLPASHYAEQYRKHDLRGGHVVKLGPGNDDAAKDSLSTWPGGLQVAGGITDKNAQYWIDHGAEKVIITSFLFPGGKFSLERLESVLSSLGGDKSKLVLDLKESISLLEPYCSEFLIHAADVEGLQQGIDEELVSKLTEWCTIPVTYAGGARSLQDLEKVHASSQGKVDLTIGSALDIFGGSGVTFDECIQWNKDH
ncbi:Enzyme that catalyzes the fourth step in the histidine pathway [Aspergillus wentii]|nr:Enzyme that catalyzes the fourth step in the histidine pathway [Aspergillus wentii]